MSLTALPSRLRLREIISAGVVVVHRNVRGAIVITIATCSMLSMQLLKFCTNLSRNSCKQIHFCVRYQAILAIPQTKLCTLIKQCAFIPPHVRTHRSSLVPGLSAIQYGYIITWVREWRLVYTKFRCFPLALPIIETRNGLRVSIIYALPKFRYPQNVRPPHF